MDSFVDMKIEELLSVNSTADGRARVHEYIQDQIKAHTSIIQYYKGRLNALTVTCRIPSEILACIFGQLVEDATAANNDVACPPFIYWIKAAAHVCSHWREIALSTPSLWSTIYPDLLHQTWTLEMLKHSKDVPLSVISSDTLSQKAYSLLKQTLSCHLPRIKNLIIGRVAPMTFQFPREGPKISPDDAQALLHLLGQHDAPIMEKLEVYCPVRWGTRFSDVQLNLPTKFTMRASSLTYLNLNGVGINWSPFPALQHLKTFKIYLPPLHQQPSMAQLLRLLSRNPLLECLSVSSIDSYQWISSLQGVERVHMEYLKRIEVVCKDLPMIASFFHHLTFPKDHKFNKLNFTIWTVDDPCTALPQLCQNMDDATEGSIKQLSLDAGGVECWKPKEEFVWYTGRWGRCWDSRAMKLCIRHYRDCDAIPLGFHMAVLRSLRLDQLTILRVNDYDDADVWSLFGSLPHLKELEVIPPGEEATIKALCPGVLVNPITSEDQTFPTFPALTCLSMFFWRLGTPIQSLSLALEREVVGEALLNCIKLRNKAMMPLERLRIRVCTGVKKLNFVSHLNELVDEVQWDGYDESD
ncbi:hypothetical protein H0H92_010743 [Tricholoma furcatifolium]|nr:hypothetical protein H0H92_010743 [Tricholoma furcatifolium]